MTALKEYERLEAPGLWRADSAAQRRDVIVSLGEATLTISDATDRALAHWSLPAIRRLNPGKRPALFTPGTTPGADSEEVLELTDDAMIGALEKLLAVLEKRRPRPGRLRQVLGGGLFLLLAAGAVFWLPGALVSYTVKVVPEAVRMELGARAAASIRHLAGRPCREPLGAAALERLGRNLLGAEAPRLQVLTDLPRPALHLPGRLVLLARSVIEAQDDPLVVAGYILAEDERARQSDPLLALLQSAGLYATIKLLTTGEMDDAVLARYGEAALLAPPPPLPAEALLARFEAAGLSASPYAHALDDTQESRLALIEADPVPLSATRLPISDGDWVSLQGICTE